MGIKNNIKQIQEEFKGDEKILENAFKLERLYYKYKYLLLVAVIILIVWLGYYNFSKYEAQKHAQKTTAIYNELLKNPQNQALLDELKASSTDLYDLYMYAQALKNNDEKILESLKNSKNPIIKTLADYQYASYSKNLIELEKTNVTPMKDFSILQEAYLLYGQNKIPQAKALLNQIERTSSVFQIASILKHYGVWMSQSKDDSDKKSTEDKSEKQ
ncbi:hypothetical protein BKH41_00555 [Helicobacter sp. 12S02232-10]|uniref:hypothetical protein n=1 Tax=Helicobacter sp. 12S02232-10 TaxID=1476197 RepID=UPI000BA6CAED|nr:hypothetical protein [Helicobacter sp. 12S02232-10]PAF49827.1 hypothetical protein BKH41_00555 [Helicobacter sp. 12S02232-10]